MKLKKRKEYKDPKVIGVTGGIGSGQTTVAEEFRILDCKVINVDNKAKQVIKKNKDVQNEIKKEFGKNVFYRNNQLNRKLLAQIVCNDEEKMQKVNQIVQPQMVESMVEEMEEARFSGKYPLVIVDAALIYEMNIEHLFDSIIVVYANKRQRLQRVVDRDKLKKEDVTARMERQIPLEDKKKWADFVVDNRGELADLKKQVEKIFEELVE